MARAFLILGGNVGDMKPRLRQAQQLLNRDAGIVLHCSHVYTSSPWGFEATSDFSNQAIELDTDLAPEELLEVLHGIENELGRDRAAEEREKRESGQPYASRAMDIDILFYNDLVMDTEKLVIPHPRMAQRDFVLTPLAEIAPRKRHPESGKTVMEIKEELAAGESLR